MIDICFDSPAQTVYAMLRANGLVADAPIMRWPDNLTVGHLVPFTAHDRARVLIDMGETLSSSFEADWCAFVDALKASDGIRAWITRTSHEAIALALTCSLVSKHATVETIDLSHVCQHLNTYGELPTNLALRTKAIDVERQSASWAEALRKNTCLRTMPNKGILNLPVSAFDHDISEAAKTSPTGRVEDIAVRASDACARVSGGPITPVFFAWRARFLGLGKK